MNFGGTIRFNNKAVAVSLVGLAAFYLLYSWSGHQSQINVDNSKVSLGELLCAAITAAEAGGVEVRNTRLQSNELNEKSKGKTKEGVKDVLTDGDMRSHQVMSKTLLNAFPNIKLISEEHDDSTSSVEPVVVNKKCLALNQVSKEEWVASDSVTVWIDPLDATKEYTENLLDYVTTMVCIAVKGEPVIGIIHKPFNEAKTTYWGWVGHGMAPELHSLNQGPEAEKETFVISRSHSGNSVENHIKSKYPNAKIEQAAGAGYKSLSVAGHKQAAYVHMTNIKKWDVCPGHAILSSLGGQVTTLKNRPLTYKPDENVVIEDGLLATLHTDDFFSKLYTP